MGLSLAIFALAAALMPGFAMLDYAILEPGWVVLPNLATRDESRPSRAFAGADAAVVPPLPGRAPPTRFLCT